MDTISKINQQIVALHERRRLIEADEFKKQIPELLKQEGLTWIRVPPDPHDISCFRKLVKVSVDEHDKYRALLIFLQINRAPHGHSMETIRMTCRYEVLASDKWTLCGLDEFEKAYESTLKELTTGEITMKNFRP